MKEYIEERAVEIANYIIDHNATVRQTAKKFGISKSTVHKDVTDRLEDVYKRQYLLSLRFIKNPPFADCIKNINILRTMKVLPVLVSHAFC